MSESKNSIKGLFANTTWQSVDSEYEGISLVPRGLIAKMSEGKLKRFLEKIRLHPSFYIEYDSFYDGDLRQYLRPKNELEEMLEENNSDVLEAEKQK